MGPLVPVKGNLNSLAYEDIVDNCVPPNLWQHFGEEPHMGLWTCAHILLGRYCIVYPGLPSPGAYFIVLYFIYSFSHL